jgi:allantoinase
LQSGDIACVVSDHSPCTGNLKQGPLDKAWGGISSLQFGLPLIAQLAREQGLNDEQAALKLTLWMSEAPARLAGLFDRKGSIAVGKDADFAVFEPRTQTSVSTADILYRNKHTPYDGMPARGQVQATFLRGELCYSRERGGIVGAPRGLPLLKRKSA